MELGFRSVPLTARLNLAQTGKCIITSAGRETYNLLLLHFAFGRERVQICQREAETLKTPGGCGADPSDSPVNPTYVRSHMPTDISYTVNVKMWKICTFGNLKNMPVGVFLRQCCS